LINAGFPRPQTQIPVLLPTGCPGYYLDMGWPDLMVSVEYDGEHHRTDRGQYTRDLARTEYIARVGWLNVRVVADHSKAEIIRRVRDAWAQRGQGRRAETA
jgi:very-short-patch-repair endonuclease